MSIVVRVLVGWLKHCSLATEKDFLQLAQLRQVHR
jgi:hypothetical protein